MTVEAPAHRERLHLHGRRHGIHASVTLLASHALVHMNRVIEVDEAGELVHAIPLYRLPAREALPHRCERRTVEPHLLVAGNAGGGGWHAGGRRALHGVVAVA